MLEKTQKFNKQGVGGGVDVYLALESTCPEVDIQKLQINYTSHITDFESFHQNLVTRISSFTIFHYMYYFHFYFQQKFHPLE